MDRLSRLPEGERKMLPVNSSLRCNAEQLTASFLRSRHRNTSRVEPCKVPRVSPRSGEIINPSGAGRPPTRGNARSTGKIRIREAPT
jgi:hypothetical protein